MEYLQEDTTEDLRYDYAEDELDFWFNDAAIDGCLLVVLQDREFIDDEDVVEE